MKSAAISTNQPQRSAAMRRAVEGFKRADGDLVGLEEAARVPLGPILNGSVFPETAVAVRMFDFMTGHLAQLRKATVTRNAGFGDFGPSLRDLQPWLDCWE